MAPVRDIPKNIQQLDREIRLNKAPAKVAPKKTKKARSTSKSAYQPAQSRGIAQAQPGIVGGARFAPTAKDAMPKCTLPERAAKAVKKLSPDARGEYLAHVLGKVYKQEASKLGFSKGGE